MASMKVADLTVEYSSGGYLVRPFENFSFEARPEELIVLLGPSGSGKTTLLSCIAGILSPKVGTIDVAGKSVTKLRGKELAEYRRRTIGVVFQAFNLIPSLTALENIEMPLRLARVGRVERRRRGQELLALVGLNDRGHHRPGQLSGGQQQRVAIARALAHDPPVVLADEPTAHLDYIQVEGVLQLLRDLPGPGRFVMVATHDERMIPLANHVIDLSPKPRAAEVSERISLEPGHLIFEQGDRGELVYMVEEGEVEIFRLRDDRSEEQVTLVRAGEYFGELAPLLGMPRAASARTRASTVLTSYSAREFRRLFGEKRAASTLE
jgi:putative ABC transport system ATP-binding protein